MARHLIPSRRGGFTVTNAVVQANRETDRKLRAGLICDACGRPFSDARPKATNPKHRGSCEECSRDFS